MDSKGMGIRAVGLHESTSSHRTSVVCCNDFRKIFPRQHEPIEMHEKQSIFIKENYRRIDSLLVIKIEENHTVGNFCNYGHFRIVFSWLGHSNQFRLSKQFLVNSSKIIGYSVTSEDAESVLLHHATEGG